MKNFDSVKRFGNGDGVHGKNLNPAATAPEVRTRTKVVLHMIVVVLIMDSDAG